MRLHSLSVSAFGPFAGTETVDFDALGADGLFLLHGETGAGKTTVLDAVAFALFGTVPGARNEARRLLSDHASPQARPEVRLELTVSGRRMRLVRSPEYQRAKRRGSGTTKENASATLTWVDEPASEGLTRLDDIGRTVSQLLGMSAEQFFQVVLLPQGEFARFLRADTDDRAVLLQKLFDTGRFSDVEKWFVDQRRTSAAQLERANADVRLVLGKLATAAGVEDHDGERDAQSWAAGLVTSTRESHQQRVAELDVARAAAKAADAALAAATGRAALQERRGRAQRQLDALEAEGASRAAQEAELAAAQRARAVALAAVDAEEAASAAAAAITQADSLSAAVQSDADGACGLAGDLAESVTSWRSEIGRLDELIGMAQRTEQDVDHLAVVESAVERTSAALAELDVRRASLPAAVASAELSLTSAQHADESLPALAEARDEAAAAAQAAAELSGARQRLAAAVEAAGKASQAHLDARQFWLDLRERRLDGMAAELATTLEADQPCPVCGSAEHPAPAVAGEQHASRAEEAQAHEVEEQTGLAKDTAASMVHQLERAVDALTLRTGGGEAAALQAAHAAACTAHAEAETAARGLIAAQKRVDELRAEQEQLAVTERELRGEFTTGAERRRSLQERIEHAQQRLREASGTDLDVHARRLRLQGLAAAASELLAARVAADSAARHATDRQHRAENAATQAGFAGLPDALAAVRDERVMRTLEELLAAARDTEISARAVLAEPEMAATPDVDVDLAGPQAARADTEVVLARTQGSAADALRRLTEVAALAAALDELCAGLGPDIAKDAELSALADVVNGRGQNSRRISLHSYVLAARLEEVAEVASVRLRRMSGGRFEFVHSDAPGARGTRGGLGLDIRDDYTGAVRSAKTLSGGESFLASLALALGLADVVSAESGGVLLDTLFIDEGFGTLDTSTLEEVMAVLDELRAGGRVVGLVSHVEELRQRIPNRLYVRKSRTGSHLELDAG